MKTASFWFVIIQKSSKR